MKERRKEGKKEGRKEGRFTGLIIFREGSVFKNILLKGK
jgi:hypothetical protein